MYIKDYCPNCNDTVMTRGENRVDSVVFYCTICNKVTDTIFKEDDDVTD